MSTGTVRVIETGEYARLGGWLLADLGATVIQACETEALPAEPGIYDREKHRVRVQPGTPLFAQTVEKLAAWADIVLVSTAEGPGALALALLEAVGGQSASVIHISGTGPGPTPARPMTELTAWAGSGIQFTLGLPTRPPAVPGGQQAAVVAGFDAAIAALSLLNASAEDRPKTIEIRLQEALVSIGGERGVPGYLDDGIPVRRDGGIGPFPARGAFPASDGLVVFVVFSDVQWDALARWMASLGATALLSPGDFAGNPLARMEMGAVINEWISETTRLHTAADLTRTGQAFGVPISPVHDMRQFAEHPLFALRGATARTASGQMHLLSPIRHLDLRGTLGDPSERESSLPG